MLEIVGKGQQFCDRISRRALLRVGALAPLGLTLPALLAGRDLQAATGGSFGRAKRCLMIFMWGGPAHQDLWDLKPQAPDNVRGEFKPISTSVPGVQICEHLQKLSRHMDKIALVRSVTHSDNRHSTGAHWMLTGHKHRLSAENFGAASTDAPHVGSVVSKLMPAEANLPTFVSLPEVIATTAGAVVPGQNGGRLGKRYDPFRIDEHPDQPDFKISSLALPEGINPFKVQSRIGLLKSFNAARRDLESLGQVRDMNAYQQRAADLITSSRARDAFDLAAEDDKDKDRYGRKTFGQSLLLARRLLEAGVKLVTVYWHRHEPGVDTTWDTHSNNFTQLKDRLIPQVDAPLAALFEDLQDRGLLDETLVVWSSEFGRTPKINAKAGRDHWGLCNTVWFAGGGVPGGQVYGSSDKLASAPASDPVNPGDVAATMFHLLGIAPDSVVYDRENRPSRVAEGRPITRLLEGAARP